MNDFHNNKDNFDIKRYWFWKLKIHQFEVASVTSIKNTTISFKAIYFFNKIKLILYQQVRKSITHLTLVKIVALQCTVWACRRAKCLLSLQSSSITDYGRLTDARCTPDEAFLSSLSTCRNICPCFLSIKHYLYKKTMMLSSYLISKVVFVCDWDLNLGCNELEI